MTRYVGIDPGQNGACVVLGDDGQTVLDEQTWNKARVPPRITVVRPGDVVSLEAQHIGADADGNLWGARASLVLAQWCGGLLVSLPPGILLLRPLATSWRAKVFRNGRLQREPAKRIAIAAATPFLTGKITHDRAEAWAIGRYSWGYAKAHPEEIAALVSA